MTCRYFKGYFPYFLVAEIIVNAFSNFLKPNLWGQLNS